MWLFRRRSTFEGIEKRLALCKFSEIFAMSPQLGQDGKAKNVSSSRKSDDSGNEDMVDGKGNVKRKSRNLSEKKRRDQFNVLINELCTMVCMGKRKLDKSNVLKTAISFIKNHNQMTVQTHTQGLQEDWKPSFLSNEEFTHLMLEALGGFILVFSSEGQILYSSENITSLLGHIPVDLMGTSIFDLLWEDERQQLTDLLKSLTNVDLESPSSNQGQVTFQCHLLRGNSKDSTESDFEQVVFNGYYRQLNGHSDSMSACDEFPMSSGKEDSNQPILSEKDESCVFVASGRLQTPQLIVEMSVIDVSKSEFTSRHSLEWKFLFLDHRAPPIIGYLPFEVLGTSGYDYYHVDDLDQVSACHESLMQKGEGTSCCYRFLTKGQQWIWLQTQYYITYHQWNSKPEFIVCTHRVVPYSEVIGHGPRCVVSTLSPLLPSLKRTSSEHVYCSQKAAIRVSSPEKETLTKSRHFRTESKRSTVYTSQNMTTSHKRASKDSDPKLSTNTHRNRSGQERLCTEDAKSTCSSESFKSTTSQLSRLSEQSLTSCQSRQSQVSLQSRQSAKSQQSVQTLASYSLVGQRNVASTAQSHRLSEERTLHSPSYVVIASSNHSNVVTSSPSAHLIPVPIIRSISPRNTRSPTGSLNHTSLEIPFQQFAQPSSPRKCAPSSLSVPNSVVSYQPVLPIGIEVGVVDTSPALTIPLLTVPGIAPHEIPPPMVLSAAQRHLYEQLKMKHSQLQRQILAQQEELKRVSEQLLIAQYGAWGPAMLKMTMPLQSELSESSGAATGLASTAVTFTPATPILVQTSAPCIITQNSLPEAVCVADPSQVILRTTQQDLIQLSQQEVQMLLAQNVLQETPNMDSG